MVKNWEKMLLIDELHMRLIFRQLYHVNQLTFNQNLLGDRMTLVLEMCQTLFFPAST